MSARIRLPAVAFAIFSAIYWYLVSDLVGVASPLGGFAKQPYWKVAIASTLPSVLYAVATLYFCHWLVHRAIRQVTKKEGD